MFSVFRRRKAAPASESPTSAKDLIDVRELIASMDVPSHLRRAEAYFEGMTLANAEFRKPFMGGEAVRLVPLMGVMLSNLEFYGGMKILDFGSGTGWLAQSLALMGAEVIAVDPSESALRLAEANTMSRHPELKGRIEYRVFDGEHLPAGSGEVDRVVCMDAFHHVPNPATVLGEFARVLASDGRAVFSEPGEAHSRSAESQHAMRTFGVIENDTVLSDIWQMARSAGFEKLRVAAYTDPPLLSLEEFDTLGRRATAPQTMQKLYDEAYSKLHGGGRQFVLMKKEQERDSRFRDGLSCKLNATPSGDGPVLHFDVIARNTGTNSWRKSGNAVGSVNAGLITRDQKGHWDYEFRRQHFLSRQLYRGEEVAFHVTVPRSDLAGRDLFIDLVAEQVIWFGQNGSPPLQMI